MVGLQGQEAIIPVEIDSQTAEIFSTGESPLTDGDYDIFYEGTQIGRFTVQNGVPGQARRLYRRAELDLDLLLAGGPVVFLRFSAGGKREPSSWKQWAERKLMPLEMLAAAAKGESCPHCGKIQKLEPRLIEEMVQDWSRTMEGLEAMMIPFRELAVEIRKQSEGYQDVLKTAGFSSPEDLDTLLGRLDALKATEFPTSSTSEAASQESEPTVEIEDEPVEQDSTPD